MSFDNNVFDDNFTFAFKSMVANNIRIATKAFDDFWQSNSEFLKDADELRGRILGYAVRQQFRKAAPQTASSFLVINKETNTYKSRAIFLKTLDYIVNVQDGQTTKLPCMAKYKMELAKGNANDNLQLQLFERAKEGVGG